MARRKPIGINNSFNGITRNSNVDRTISADSLVSIANKISNDISQSAYSKYNASLFPKVNIETPIIPDSIPQQNINANVVNTVNESKPLSYNPNRVQASFYKGKGSQFANDIYQSYYRAVRPGAASDADAARQAKYLTQKACFETAYGRHMANTHNYGGHRINGKWLSFNSMDDFTKRDVALLDKKWSNWRNAKNENDFVNAITTNRGRGAYAPRHEYNGYFGLTNRVNSYLGYRPKAWIGAAIGAATSILGSVLSSNAQKKQLEAQRREQAYKNALQTSQGLNESMKLMQDAQREYENRFRIAYRNGGRLKANLGFLLPILGNFAGSLVDEFTAKDNAKIINDDTVLEEEKGDVMRRGGRRRLRDGVNITDGGYAIPIGNNTFLLRGGSHEDVNETGQTGIGLNVGGKEIEAEGGEVVQKTPSEVRVFSNSIVLPNGMTPAEAVENGIDKNKVFNIQQNMNNNNGIKSKRRLRNVGCVSRPVERIKAEGGIKVDRNGRRYKTETGRKADGTWYERIIYLDEKPKTSFSNKGNWENVSRATGGVRGNNSQSAYAKAKAQGNTRSLVGSDRKRRLAASSIASIGSGGSNKSAGTTGVRLSPNLSDIGSVSAIRELNSDNYKPDYTPEQEIDYINSQTGGAAGDTTRGEEHYTNPAERELREYQRAVESGEITQPTSTYTGNVSLGSPNRLGLVTKGADWIGLGADLIGGLGSALINYSAANNIPDPIAPVRVSPAKLITNYNVAPRLARYAMMRDAMLKDSDEALSSAARLDRRNRINTFVNSQVDETLGEKTNREVELLNQDALNQQEVNARNVEMYNRYLDQLTNARTNRSLMRSQALQMGLNGIGDAVGNFLDQGKQRYSDQQTMRYYMALLPEEGRRWLMRNGIDFLRRGGRIR